MPTQPNPAPQKPKLRGLHEIRTSTGPARGEANLPQIYMRLCALEMERHRREHERRAALERMRVCDERCAEIDAERQILLTTMATLTQKRDLQETEQVLVPRAGVVPPERRAKPVGFVEPTQRPLTHRY